MDYEKKYKEALANARQEYNTTENVERKQWLEELFPELKESEDERIRKEILSLVQYTKGRLIGYKPRIHQDKMITWLEKQGDSPIKWNKNTKGNKPQKKTFRSYKNNSWHCRRRVEWGRTLDSIQMVR